MRRAVISISAIALGLTVIGAVLVMLLSGFGSFGGVKLQWSPDPRLWLAVFAIAGLAELAASAAVCGAVIMAARGCEWLGLALLLLGALATMAGPLYANGAISRRPCGTPHAWCLPHQAGGLVPGLISTLLLMPLLTLTYALLAERRALRRGVAGTLVAITLAVRLIAAPPWIV